MADELDASGSAMAAVLAWADTESFVPLVFHGSVAEAQLEAWVEPALRQAIGAGPGAVAPNQADLLVVVGSISQKAGPILQRVFGAMADPRLVLQIGAPQEDRRLRSYAVVPRLEEVLPVDVILEGARPTPGQIQACVGALRDAARRWRDGVVEVDPDMSSEAPPVGGAA